MKNLKRIGKKLYHCQNPEKADLVGLNRAQKRDGGVSSTATAAVASGGISGTASAAPTPVDEGPAGQVPAEGDEDSESARAAKKRRLEREKFAHEGADLFGGELIREKK
jgi:cyclin H